MTDPSAEHSPVPPPSLSAAVEYAIARTRAELRREGLAAALLFDPVNVRYVTGTRLMPVWTLHSLDRFVLVPAESEPVMWDYPSVPPDVVSPLDDLDVRTATSWAPFGSGNLSSERARAFAAEVVEELRDRGIAGEPIGVDRLDAYGFLALQDEGLHIEAVQLALERARAVKSPDELAFLRHSARACDDAVAKLYENLRPGMTENEAWAIFTGDAFGQGGEYVETRLLSSGPRTNPWFHEASDRPMEQGELIAFDTDLIGPGGYLADISRTYLVGAAPPTDQQRRLYATAHDFVQAIVDSLRPGAALDELGDALSRRMPKAYHPQRYPFIAHGTGLSDEYPVIVFDGHHQGEVEAGMVLSVEAYVGAVGEDEGVKLEEEVLVTDDGVEYLSHAPHDERLLP